jgi:hypothetical protein
MRRIGKGRILRVPNLGLGHPSGAGRNYLFVGNGNAVVQNPSIRPMLVKIYKPFRGQSRVTSVEDAVEP